MLLADLMLCEETTRHINDKKGAEGQAEPCPGNRQLNAAIHRIAITQIRLDGLAQANYRKKKAEGMSNPEALRCLIG